MADKEQSSRLQVAVEAVRAYHEATKHHPHRYARSLGYLDWANQPDPFRRYAGAPLYLLPFPETDDSPPYDALAAPASIPPRPLNPLSIGQFFESALGLSASKEYQGSRWELRCNPSSGNLHPTEGYLVSDFTGAPCVYHYAPREHGLERRAALPARAWARLTDEFPKPVFFVGIATIQWRETWKYGERAYRYCNHDVGHALAALSFSATALGWRLVHLDAAPDAEVAALLGLDRSQEHGDAEIEHPDLLAAVVPANHATPIPNGFAADSQRQTGAAARGVEWLGRANRLSREHRAWEIIEKTTLACRKPSTQPQAYPPCTPGVPQRPSAGPTARRIFQQRRSAVDMDGVTSLSASAFYRILARTLPDPGAPPWWSAPPETRVHLGLFVHRVTGLQPGLYLLARDPAGTAALRGAMHPFFAWECPADAPESLPLFLLEAGDCRRIATQVSCQQDIAGDGVFSVAMLSCFDEPLRARGVVVSAPVLGSRDDRPGVIPGSRTRGRARHGNRLLF